MARKKSAPTPRHPNEAMARFDRLLTQMAPKAEAPEGRAPKPLRARGQRAKGKLKPSAM